MTATTTTVAYHTEEEDASTSCEKEGGLLLELRRASNHVDEVQTIPTEITIEFARKSKTSVAVIEEFQDVGFSYGVSDEFSFVLKKDSQFHGRHASGIVSVVVSFFSSKYVMQWKDFFPQKELKKPPSFDGRAVCYPSTEILRDYLAWRQVDCEYLLTKLPLFGYEIS